MKFNVEYYDRGNFGDDLFLVILAEYFPNVRFNIIGNPVYFKRIKNLPPNIEYKCIPNFLRNAISAISGRYNIAMFGKMCDKLQSKIYNSAIPYIRIGGSIFMESPQVSEESH